VIRVIRVICEICGLKLDFWCLFFNLWDLEVLGLFHACPGSKEPAGERFYIGIKYPYLVIVALALDSDTVFCALKAVLEF